MQVQVKSPMIVNICRCSKISIYLEEKVEEELKSLPWVVERILVRLRMLSSFKENFTDLSMFRSLVLNRIQVLLLVGQPKYLGMKSSFRSLLIRFARDSHRFSLKL